MASSSSTDEYVFKVALVGASGVGKSSLLYRFTHHCTHEAASSVGAGKPRGENGEEEEEEDDEGDDDEAAAVREMMPTLGVDFVSHTEKNYRKNVDVRLQFWDLAGSGGGGGGSISGSEEEEEGEEKGEGKRNDDAATTTAALTTLRNASFALALFDVNDRSTLECLAEVWLPELEMNNVDPRTQVLLVGNKIDLRQGGDQSQPKENDEDDDTEIRKRRRKRKIPVTPQQISSLLTQWRGIRYCETSCLRVEEGEEPSSSNDNNNSSHSSHTPRRVLERILYTCADPAIQAAGTEDTINKNKYTAMARARQQHQQQQPAKTIRSDDMNEESPAPRLVSAAQMAYTEELVGEDPEEVENNHTRRKATTPEGMAAPPSQPTVTAAAPVHPSLHGRHQHLPTVNNSKKRGKGLAVSRTASRTNEEEEEADEDENAMDEGGSYSDPEPSISADQRGRGASGGGGGGGDAPPAGGGFHAVVTLPAPSRSSTKTTTGRGSSNNYGQQADAGEEEEDAAAHDRRRRRSQMIRTRGSVSGPSGIDNGTTTAGRRRPLSSREKYKASTTTTTTTTGGRGGRLGRGGAVVKRDDQLYDDNAKYEEEEEEEGEEMRPRRASALNDELPPARHKKKEKTACGCC